MFGQKRSSQKRLQADISIGLGIASSATLLASLLSPLSAQATTKLDATLLATESCEAVQSIRKRTNAGQIRLRLGQRYRVIGQNRTKDATHYLLKLDDARPNQRWVSIRCGSLEGQPAAQPQTETPAPAEPVSQPVTPPTTTTGPPLPNTIQPDLDTSRRADFLLALSWQPAFCETRPNKTECRSQSADSFEAGNLALHGLWPQPRGNDYCGVSLEIERLDKRKRWDKLPPIELSPQTRTALADQMPGYASGLHLHEWYKHGTCYSNSPEEYYRESLALMDQVNESLVQVLFEENLGQRISGQDIRRAFDQAFGAGAGQKVEVACAKDINQGRRLMVQELRILLKGKVEPGTDIADLLAEAPRAKAGCRSGLVDFAGVDR